MLQATQDYFDDQILMMGLTDEQADTIATLIQSAWATGVLDGLHRARTGLMRGEEE